MTSKILKIFIFLLYTLFIFQSYVFVIVPTAMIIGYDYFSVRFLITVFFPIYTLTYFLLHTVFVEIPFRIFESIPDDIPGTLLNIGLYIVPPILILCLLFYWWFKKQSPLTAWGVAFLGSCYAFMIFPSSFVFGDGSHKDAFGWIAIPFVNLFYFVLCIIDYNQKKFWPHNKFCNKIRRILASLCINPASCMSILT